MPSISPLTACTHTHTGSRNFPPRRTARGGFALIIALVLMGFLLMLVLSLSSLVKTDITTSALGQNSSLAQRNALLGLQIAIGQLQQYTGPDQIATARADIKGQSVTNPYWTGVWDKDGTLLTYLVSGNEESAKALLYDETTSLSDDRTDTNAGIVLDRNSHTNEEILAKLITFKDANNEGGYAYWISDESVKAKINLLPTTSPASAPENFGLMVPQHFGFENLRSWFNQSDWFSGNDDLDNEALKPARALVDAGTLASLRGEGVDDLQNDITLYSYGVFSNPRTGGLKKDLTAAFDGGLDSGLKGEHIFSGNDNDTPLWDQLYSWATTVPDPTLPVRAGTNTEVGIFPVLLGFQLYMVPAYEEISATEYKVYDYIVPTVALWNPYSTRLEAKDYKVVSGRTQKGSSINHLDDIAAGELNQAYLILFATDEAGTTYNQEPTDFDTKPKRYNLNALRDIVNTYSGGQYVHNETLEFVIPSVSLAPGEVQLYTPGSNQPYIVGSGSRRELVAGNNPFGFYIDLERNLNTFNDPVNGTQPITKFKPTHPYNNVPARVGAMQLMIDGGDVLSDTVYLNQTPSAAGAPSGINMQMRPGANDDLLMDDVSSNTRAFGWVAIRNMGISTPLTEHRESSQLDADYKWLAHYNPRAATSGPHPVSYRASKTNYDTSTTANPSFISLADHRGESVHSLADLVNTINNRSSDGFILFEPSPGVENIFTIGQLTHAPLFYWNDTHNGSSYGHTDTTRIRPRVENAAFDNLVPANPIGNSRANPAIPLDQTQRSMDVGASESFQQFTTGTLYDYSYLLNEALWDDYFFSAVISSGNDTEGNPIYNASRNPRIIALPSVTNVERGLKTSARDLMIDGPFNVNSTSENAWKALLTSFYGRTPGSAESITRANEDEAPRPTRAPFMRVAKPGSNETKTNPGVNDKVTYSGYSSLDEAQIDALAKAIVEEIRERGIATSLSSFINRSLDGSSEAQQIQGALSAAIEKAGSGDDGKINENLRVSGQESSTWRKVNATGLQFPAAAEGYITEGLPGWLTAADLLSRLGSVLTSRGDTFLIRAYGEYGPENSLSKAWCEAVVQRLPEPVQADANGEPNDFGRRFVVLGFRWLNADEI